jgi:hypothetical protein
MPEIRDKLENFPVAKEFETAAEAQPQPDAPSKWVREIEVGGRKQKFEADTYEGLIDKLVEAQTNATRKLEEFASQTKRVLTPEQRSSDWSEIKTQPLEGQDAALVDNFRRMFAAETGMSPDEFRGRENERRRLEAEGRATNDFVRRHLNEYNPVPENAQKIYRFLEQESLPISKRNLDYAYEQLRGELTPKPTPTPTAQPPAAEPGGFPEMGRSSPPQMSSTPPSFLRPSLGGRPHQDTGGGIDAAEAARIAQLPPAEMKARIEQIFRQSRSVR